MTLSLLYDWLIKQEPPHQDIASRMRSRGLQWKPQTHRWIRPTTGSEWTTFLTSPNNNASEIFNESPIGIMVAAHQIGELGIKVVHPSVLKAIEENKDKLADVEPKIIGQELMNTVSSKDPAKAFEFMAQNDLLKYIHPKLDLTVGWPQNNPNHKYDVWGHNLAALDWVVNESSMKDNPILRLSAFLHDIGKPDTANEDNSFFPDHHHVGADITQEVLDRLEISDDIKQAVVTIIDQHMFIHMFGHKDNAEKFQEFAEKTGQNIELLYELARADTMGRGHPDTTMDKIDKKIENTKKYVSHISKSFDSLLKLTTWLGKK